MSEIHTLEGESPLFELETRPGRFLRICTECEHAYWAAPYEQCTSKMCHHGQALWEDYSTAWAREHPEEARRAASLSVTSRVTGGKG